jgi:hypothetical protein
VFLAHISSVRDHGLRTEFSIGVAIGASVRAAITASEWVPALDGDNSLRDGAELVELSGLVDPVLLASFPAGTRLICRRERPHPGAQLSLFDTINGVRHQVFATDTPHGAGSVQFLEVRHRAHARVEDRIRTGKATGFGRFPSRVFAINAAWLELALTGIDLLAWTQTLLLDGARVAGRPRRGRRRAWVLTCCVIFWSVAGGCSLAGSDGRLPLVPAAAARAPVIPGIAGGSW